MVFSQPGSPLQVCWDGSSCFGLFKQGTQIHALVYKREFEDDTIVATALINMYSKLGSLKHAGELFNGVCVKDLLIIGITAEWER